MRQSNVTEVGVKTFNESSFVALCVLRLLAYLATLGAVHKVRHTVLDQF